MSDLLKQLEAWANQESDSNMGHAMLALLAPVLEAADRLDACLCEFGDDPAYCDDHTQRVHDALADLRAKLGAK